MSRHSSLLSSSPPSALIELIRRTLNLSYVDLCDMHLTKTHNSGTAIYLWEVKQGRLYKNVMHNLCTVLLNLRLRRMHEVEAGSEWMSRAKDQGQSEENENEEDKKRYLAFCTGLQRLDSAILQVDETLMIFSDL